MGNYNPHAPLILGQEWVPIRDEDIVFSPNVNSIEIGQPFALTAATNVNNARFYVNTPQPTPQIRQCGLVNIYPDGLEDVTGPIRQVIIPCNNGGVTGTAVTFNGGTIAESVKSPSSDYHVEFGYAGGLIGTEAAEFFFAVNQYPELANKRILNVSLVYTGSVFDQNALGEEIDYVNPDPDTPLTVLSLSGANGTLSFTYSPPTSGKTNTGALADLATSVNNANSQPYAGQEYAYVDLGDVNPWWDATISPTSTNDRMPWRYTDMQRFEATAGATRMSVRLRVQQQTSAGSPNTPFTWISYLALRVIYCEETRVAYGAKLFNYEYGANRITLRNTAFVPNPSLAAGRYLPTLSWVSPGQTDFGQASSGDFPHLNGVRELYPITAHPGTQVNVPFPLEERLGDTFTSEATEILPQLTIHASGTGGALTQPHVYGRQAAAQVWGAHTATQEIYDDITGVAASYPQVRYYARRFGDTVMPLTLTGNGTLTGSTTQITVADFDQLVEILDGWKEVTLRFAVAPNMGAVTGTPGWTWSATGELAGNRWEILAASAPALTGTPGGNLYLQVPSNSLAGGTYQPPSGSSVELTWMPQGVASPWVTGASADSSTDAVLIFSQDPPTITGMSLTPQTQVVTGFGLDCGALPCCIPTGIAYNQVSWSLPNGSVGLGLDNFDDVVPPGGWGNADVGGAWTPSSLPAEFAKTGTLGTITVTNEKYITIPSVGPDFDIFTHTGFQAIQAGSQGRTGLVGRYTDGNNHYIAQLLTSTITGLTTCHIGKRVAGSSSTIAGAITLPFNVNSGGMVWMRFMGAGTTIKMKIWPGNRDEEPLPWTLEVIDTSLTTGDGAGCFARSDTLSGNVAIFDYFEAGPPQFWFGAYESSAGTPRPAATSRPSCARPTRA